MRAVPNHPRDAWQGSSRIGRCDQMSYLTSWGFFRAVIQLFGGYILWLLGIIQIYSVTTGSIQTGMFWEVHLAPKDCVFCTKIHRQIQICHQSGILGWGGCTAPCALSIDTRFGLFLFLFNFWCVWLWCSSAICSNFGERRSQRYSHHVSKEGHRLHHLSLFELFHGGGDEWLNASEYRIPQMAFSMVWSFSNDLLSSMFWTDKICFLSAHTGTKNLGWHIEPSEREERLAWRHRRGSQEANVNSSGLWSKRPSHLVQASTKLHVLL